MKILLIDNYDSFTYNLVHRLRECGGGAITVVRNDAVELGNIGEFSHLVLSPGPGIPSETGRMMELILRARATIPILGVCLGHQAIAETYGAKLRNLNAVVHGKATPIHRTSVPSRLFTGVPQSFIAARYHSWVAEKSTLPHELAVTAICDEGEVMAIEHRELPIFGVQFHPESIMTEVGTQILSNWISL